MSNHFEMPAGGLVAGGVEDAVVAGAAAPVPEDEASLEAGSMSGLLMPPSFKLADTFRPCLSAVSLPLVLAAGSLLIFSGISLFRDSTSGTVNAAFAARTCRLSTPT